MKRHQATLSMIAVATALALGGAPAFAEAAKKMTVDMSAKQEVPPNDSKATGKADLTFDPASKVLTWKVTAKDLTGEPMAAHLHGPAEPGANGGVLVNLAPDGAKLPLEGKATLTDEQVAALMAGKTYVNVHTPDHKGGEIRGQVKP